MALKDGLRFNHIHIHQKNIKNYDTYRNSKNREESIEIIRYKDYAKKNYSYNLRVMKR